MNNKRRALVTGASGFSGRQVVDALSRRGVEVWALSNAPPSPPLAEATWVTADLRQPLARGIIPTRWDWVVHLAAFSVPSEVADETAMFDNVRMLLHLLQHIEAGRIVVASSALVYDRSGTAPLTESSPVAAHGGYELSKVLTEACAFAHATRLEVIVTRGFNHIGVGMRRELVVPTIVRRSRELPAGEPLELDGADSIRDYVDVRDVGAAYVALLESDRAVGQVVNVCTGRPTRVSEVASALLDARGDRRTVSFRRAAGDRLVGSPRKLKELTGWEPRYTLTESARWIATAEEMS